MMDQELKEFLAISLGQLSADISRLSGVVSNQSVIINEINIKSTTRIAELQKDIIDIQNDIVDIKAEQKNLGDSQKFKWKTLTEQREADKREQEKKDTQQAVINSSMEMINKLLWAIFLIVLTLVIGFVWQLIVNGGIKGVTI